MDRFFQSLTGKLYSGKVPDPQAECRNTTTRGRLQRWKIEARFNSRCNTQLRGMTPEEYSKNPIDFRTPNSFISVKPAGRNLD